MHVLIWEFEYRYVQNYWNTCIWIGTFSVFTASLQHVTSGNIQHGVVRSVQHSIILSDLLSSGKNRLIGLLITRWLMEMGNFSFHVDFIFGLRVWKSSLICILFIYFFTFFWQWYETYENNECSLLIFL